MSRNGIIGVLLGIAGLYALGLNPFVMPESTDDITYFELGRSLAEGRGYTYHGEIITDWPPLYPAVISLLFRMGIDSLVAIKALSIVFAIAALWLGYRLLQVEGRRSPMLTIALFALFPTCFLYGVRTASEWLFMVLSFGFFLALRRLYEADPARLRQAVFVGVLLGLASLTRMVGVLLGVAILLQMGMKWMDLHRKERRPPIARRVRTIVPEFIAASLGATMFIAWRVYLTYGTESGDVAVGNYDLNGFHLWSSFAPIEMLSQLNELFFQVDELLAVTGLIQFEPVVAILIGIVLLVGLWQKVASREFYPSDAYVIATLLMLMSYENIATRFFIAIAPFLIGWLLRGLTVTAESVRLPSRRVLTIFATCWAIGLLAIDVYLILRGNEKDHGPLTGIISRDESAFYQNLYADLREVSLEIAEADPDAVVGVYGWYANFISAIAGVHGVNHEYTTPYDWYVGTFQDDGQLPTLVLSSFEKLREVGEVTVYRRVK